MIRFFTILLLTVPLLTHAESGAKKKYLFDSLSQQERVRVIFIHMNHTNPLLIDGSPAQAEVIRRGYQLVREGMRLPL